MERRAPPVAGDLREAQCVPLPLQARGDQPEAHPVVEPSVNGHQLRLGRLHAECDERGDEQTPPAGEIAQFHHGARRSCSRSLSDFPNPALTIGHSSPHSVSRITRMAM